MDIYFSLFFFIFGTCWGSFTNVLIDRTQKKRSIKGRSKCDFCGVVLKWFDNVPVLSFLFLGGHCRECKKKLSWQYPIVELSTGAVFLLTFKIIQQAGIFNVYSSGFWDVFSLVYYFGVVYLLWVILIWDLKYMIIPDFIITVGVVLTFVYKFYEIFIFKGSWLSIDFPLTDGLLGAVVLGGFFALMYWKSKGKWIGGGDVKLGFWLGLMAGIKMVYFLILFAYTSGALVAILLLIFKSKKMKSEIPFGPFLVLGSYLVIFYQEMILKIWHSLI